MGTAVSSSVGPATTHIPNHIRSRANNRNLTDVTLNFVLSLKTCILCIASLGCRDASLSTEPDVLMISYGVFA